MNDNREKEPPAYIIHNVSRILIIEENELYFKAPHLKNNEYKYRCRKTDCNYFI